MQRYLLAVDQGTTGTTALIFDADLNIKGKVTIDFHQHFPEANWVEHDLEEIWSTVVGAVGQVLAKAKIQGSEIAAIGITNQRETTCLWERGRDAKPVHRAIVWQDRRTHLECEKMKKAGLEKKVHKITGLLLDPYFSGTKLQWLLKNVPGAAEKAKAGHLAFGTIDSYLLYRMSGSHCTDPSNACRTLLMDLKTCKWSEEMLKLLKIPKGILPEIRPSATEYGRTKDFPGLPNGIPISGLAGDQQAALFGQACFEVGSAKCTYGTGAFILMNTGHTAVYSKHKLLTSVAWQLGSKPTYVLEGSAFIAGASVQWLRDQLGIISTSPEVAKLAASVPNSDGVTFVPALSGMGAPHWLPLASGLITGITRRTSKAHIARATLDGIAFQVAELLSAMNKDFGKKLTSLKVDGGASANDLLIQFQTDLLGIKVTRSEIVETTALGAGLQAGLAIGFWKDMNEIKAKWKANKTFQSTISPKERASEMARWDKAMKAVKLLA